jgi:hypothetical protein
VTVTIGAPASDAPGTDLTHADAEAVVEIAQEAAAEAVEPVIEAVVDAQIQGAKNQYEIEGLNEWKTQTDQTLETLTEATLSMSTTMQQILSLLQSTAAEPPAQPTPQDSPNADAEDPGKTVEIPASQEAPDNKQEKAKEKRKRNWV